MKVEAVVFDLGKVLVDFDYGIAARRLAENSSSTCGEIRTVIDQSPLLFRYESAAISTQEFFNEVKTRIGYRGAFDRFAACFGDIFTEIPEMIGLHARLRTEGVPTYILSNTNDIAVHHIRRRFPFFAHFTGYIFSYECSALKPHPPIYQATEHMTGCRGAEILFLDDKPENVEAAAQRGWQTICHTSPTESIAKVKALLPP